MIRNRNRNENHDRIKMNWMKNEKNRNEKSWENKNDVIV